jgi:outer membrane lipoprotein LolB
MKKLFTTLILIALVPLSGCVSMRGPKLSHAQTDFSVQSRQAIVKRLKALSVWQADGAFSFDAQNQVGMADFRIDVSPYTWRVQISSGLNLVQMTIGSDAQGVWYTDQHGHRQHAQSLQAVMKAQFGFALPVVTLIDWMKGLPTSDQAVINLNHFNQLAVLKENGWMLHYSQYGLYHGVSLPGTILITGHGEKIKMVIRQWH